MTRDTTPTDRRDYDRPEIGDDWAQAWDDLVEDVDANALFDENGEINTANLSDDAITAAKIAAAAVDSGAIADGAVGVDELADALGTSDTDRVPGTTHFETADANSVNTGQLGNDGSPITLTDHFSKDVSDENQATLSAASVDSNSSYGEAVQFENGVDNSGTIIFDIDKIPDTTNIANFLVVQGGEQGPSDARFVDVVLVIRTGGTNVIESLDDQSPPSRTYAEPSDVNGALQLTMASGTFNVVTAGSVFGVFD